MGYVLDVTSGETLGEMVVEGHTATRYRVMVSPVEERRWAEVDCDCGVTSRQDWIAGMVSFRCVVMTAWALGCGSRAPIADSRASVSSF